MIGETQYHGLNNIISLFTCRDERILTVIVVDTVRSHFTGIFSILNQSHEIGTFEVRQERVNCFSGSLITLPLLCLPIATQV